MLHLNIANLLWYIQNNPLLGEKDLKPTRQGIIDSAWIVIPAWDAMAVMRIRMTRIEIKIGHRGGSDTYYYSTNLTRELYTKLNLVFSEGLTSGMYYKPILRKIQIFLWIHTVFDTGLFSKTWNSAYENSTSFSVPQGEKTKNPSFLLQVRLKKGGQ